MRSFWISALLWALTSSPFAGAAHAGKSLVIGAARDHVAHNGYYSAKAQRAAKLPRAKSKKGGKFTEPTLPPKTVFAHSGIQIVHFTRSGDHGPAHLHVQGGGPNVRIGANGHPLSSSPMPTTNQLRVIVKGLTAVRRATAKIQKWYRWENELWDGAAAPVGASASKSSRR